MVKRGLRKVRYRPQLIDGCLAGTGLITAPALTTVLAQAE